MARTSKMWLALAAGAIAAASAGTAHAVPSYGNIVDPPGVYFGSGNVNGDWTIETANGVEAALRAKNRDTLVTIDGSSGIYHANPGLSTAPGSPKAKWNYELSVNTQIGGSTLTLDDVIVELGVDTNPGAGTTFTFLDVLSNWPDTYYWDGSAPRRSASTPVLGEFGAQQSANPLFGDSGFGFLPGGGLYDLELSVYQKDPLGQKGSLLARSSIQVQVPEPASILLLGVGLLGFAFSTRRKAAA